MRDRRKLHVIQMRVKTLRKKLIPTSTEASKYVNQYPFTESIPIDFSNDYLTLLTKRSALRRNLNKHIRSSKLDAKLADKLIEIYFQSKNALNPSDACIHTKCQHFERIIQIVKGKSISIYEYKSLGTSAQIQPTRYGQTINSFNFIFRNYLFEEMNQWLQKNEKMVLLDLDLSFF